MPGPFFGVWVNLSIKELGRRLPMLPFTGSLPVGSLPLVGPYGSKATNWGTGSVDVFQLWLFFETVQNLKRGDRRLQGAKIPPECSPTEGARLPGAERVLTQCSECEGGGLLCEGTLFEPCLKGNQKETVIFGVPQRAQEFVESAKTSAHAACDCFWVA